MTTFIVEHQCPQCGAPTRLQETDRLIRCSYCRVGSYLTTSSYFRYLLPSKAPKNAELIWFPYWRLKGMLFSCTARQIEKRFLDVSYQAIPLPAVPPSLGFRSQTQRLRFAMQNTTGIFLKPHTKPQQSLELALKQFGTLTGKSLYQEYIGETVSLIYAPFYFKNRLYDALLNEPVTLPGSNDLQQINCLAGEPPDWPLDFTPTLCPACGWDLDGSPDSLVLTCSNCQSIWQPKAKSLYQIKAAHQPAENEDQSVYLPFWRIRATVNGARLQSYADLVKLANLPKVVQPGWNQRRFHFWSPAFKVRPQKFLNLTSQMTLSQPEGQWKPQPPKGELYPVNLPVSEAAQALKLSLACFLRPKQKLTEILPEITVKPKSFVLVYLPFTRGQHELINRKLQLALSNNMLALAYNL